MSTVMVSTVSYKYLPDVLNLLFLVQRIAVWTGEILPSEGGECQGGGSFNQLLLCHAPPTPRPGGAAQPAHPSSGLQAR
jgi:hypothetical protein